MADSDPRKMRPPQNSDRRAFDAEEDPLMELARIVSEDSGFYGAKAQKPGAGRESIDRNAFSADLESELLQELESSFVSRPPPAPAVRPAAQAAAPQPPVDDADDLLRSIEAQLGEFERRAKPASPIPVEPADDEGPGKAPKSHEEAPAEVEPVAARSDRAARDATAAVPEEVEARRESSRAAYPEDLPPRPLPTRFATRLGRGSEPAPRWSRGDARQAGPYVRPRDASADVGEGRAGEEPSIGSAARSAPAGTAAGRRPSGPGDEALGAASLTSSAAASSTTDLGGQLRTTFGGLDEALTSGSPDPAGAPDVEAELTRELEPSYSDPTFGGHWQDAGADASQDNFRVNSLAPATYAPVPRGTGRDRSRRGLTIIAALLGLVVLAGGVAAYLRSGDEAPSGPPPVIAADEGAVKIEPPPPPAAEGETVGEAVYNRVAGDAPPAEEQVVDSAEEPREISRIVLPATGAEDEVGLVREVGEESGAPAGEQITTEQPPAETVGPRRVRTYVVRPDGTIIATGEAPAGTAAPAQEPEMSIAAAQIDPVPVQTTPVDETGEPRGDAAAEPAPVVAAVAEPPEPAPEAAAPETPATAPPPPEAAAAAAEDLATAEPVAPLPAETVPAETAPAEPPVEPAPPVAPPEAAEPEPAVGVAAAEPEPAAEATPAPPEGHYVQLSSQREEAQAQASLASMQSRYSAILGGLNPDIQRADLGARGIYYRARVGPFASRPDAIEVCESLKAAGGTCIVTR